MVLSPPHTRTSCLPLQHTNPNNQTCSSQMHTTHHHAPQIPHGQWPPMKPPTTFHTPERCPRIVTILRGNRHMHKTEGRVGTRMRQYDTGNKIPHHRSRPPPPKEPLPPIAWPRLALLILPPSLSIKCSIHT
jgi:hypothetical protein